MGVSSVRARAALALTTRLDGEMLYISAPGLHFLAGKPLERLKDGATVVFAAQLSLSLDDHRTIFRPVRQRFVFSYDIWEEKFSVMSSSRRTGMTAAEAEAWCLEKLAISASGIPPDRPVWLRLDLRAVDAKEAAGVVTENGFSLRNLIETFSRPARTEQPHWVLEQGPFRLGDLRKAETRGSRSG